MFSEAIYSFSLVDLMFFHPSVNFFGNNRFSFFANMYLLTKAVN
jgi:hypothetical protein